MYRWGFAVFVLLAAVVTTAGFMPVTCACAAPATFGPTAASGYKVLEPIESGSLTVFPVVAGTTHDTSGFLTLDEGLRSGDVVVTEAGNTQGLVRGPHQPLRHDGAQVNTLVLINRSDKPLILLAGEIVTGGKQDRIIGKDRIVPAHSDPIDLGVFCVEPGRWVAQSDRFGATAAAAPMMAQPSVRSRAMADKNQQEVWNAVHGAAETVTVEASRDPDSIQHDVNQAMLGGTTSYAKVMNSAPARKAVDKVAAPIEHQYRDLMHQLHDRKAVGVVVAVHGRIIWADVFASTELLEKYWPKLIRSYAAESFGGGATKAGADVAAAQEFLEQLTGEHEVVESDPGVYREAEITGANFSVFQLTSLVPKTDFDIHIAKMSDVKLAEAKPIQAPHGYIVR